MDLNFNMENAAIRGREISSTLFELNLNQWYWKGDWQFEQYCGLLNNLLQPEYTFEEYKKWLDSLEYVLYSKAWSRDESPMLDVICNQLDKHIAECREVYDSFRNKSTLNDLPLKTDMEEHIEWMQTLQTLKLEGKLSITDAATLKHNIDTAISIIDTELSNLRELENSPMQADKAIQWQIEKVKYIAARLV